MWRLSKYKQKLMMLPWTSVSHEVYYTIAHLTVELCDWLVTTGADGGLDFQCIRVGDEAKQSIQLKNKGKYDIEYRCVCIN